LEVMAKKLLALSFIYFLVRLTNLTNLPIFNDEAIYLDWGFKAIHDKALLFFSLSDAKQPFLMWVFGIFETFFPDPLFAGRFVSIVAGFATLVGLYRLAEEFFDSKVAKTASLLYIAIPIFSFFDRQALMESAVAAAGVWSCYFFIRLHKTPSKQFAVLLGITLGLSFFIKSSGLIFIASYLLLTIFLKQKSKIYLFLTIYFILAVNYIILRQPLFWQTLSTNDRYSLTIAELLRFPFTHWFGALLQSIELAFWFLTPVVFCLATLGIVIVLRGSDRWKKTIAAWFLINIALVILVARDLSPRYIVSFLAPVTLFCVVGVKFFVKKYSLNLFLVYGIVLVVPFFITVIQIFSPLKYFSVASSVTSLSQKNEYVTEWPSGYGIPEVINFLNSRAKDGAILAGVRIDAGNPENAIFTYFNSSRFVRPIYFDVKVIRSDGLDCISVEKPLYFISRDNQLAGLDKFLEEVKRVYKPEGRSYIGIHRLKTNC